MQPNNEVNDDNGGTTYYFSRNKARPSFAQRLRLFVAIYWKSILIVLTPIIFLPLPIMNHDKAYRCMYVVLIMAVYWVLELLPLPVTSMLPIVLFPTLGILNSDQTSMTYMKETNMMFMGGLMIAAGVQHSKLPKRVALKTIQIVGCSHRRLNFGLTFVTMFISMWVSNAAATTMMVPIVEAILDVLEQQGLGDVYIKKPNTGNENGKAVKQAGEVEETPTPSDTTICYYLSIAYAATIGGCCTLVGTATNSSFKGIYETKYPNEELNFFWFMAYTTPPMLVMQLLIWLSLQVVFMGMFRPKSEAAKRVNMGSAGNEVTLKVIDEQYRNLGPTTFHEACFLLQSAGLLFLLAVFLYIFRSPGFILGWADVMTNLKVKDGVTSMLIVILMFMVPMSSDFLNFFFGDHSLEELKATKAAPGVVTWKVLKDKIPWGLFFLLGGGFCLAKGSESSGLSEMIASQLTSLGNLPDVVVLLVVVLVTQFLTEFTSNVAIANLILPVLAKTADKLGIPPLYLMIPVTHACSMAFLMPVGTPPNAIVAGVAHIPTYKMAIGGVLPKLITTLLVWGSFPTWGALIYPAPASLAASNATLALLNATAALNATTLDFSNGVIENQLAWYGS